MAKWDELKDWIEKGAFYHGNETPKPTTTCLKSKWLEKSKVS